MTVIITVTEKQENKREVKTMEILLGLDKILFALIEGSGFTMLAILGILKILAKETKWSGDDKIIAMFMGMIKGHRTSKEK